MVVVFIIVIRGTAGIIGKDMFLTTKSSMIGMISFSGLRFRSYHHGVILTFIRLVAISIMFMIVVVVVHVCVRVSLQMSIGCTTTGTQVAVIIFFKFYSPLQKAKVFSCFRLCCKIQDIVSNTLYVLSSVIFYVHQT